MLFAKISQLDHIVWERLCGAVIDSPLFEFSAFDCDRLATFLIAFDLQLFWQRPTYYIGTLRPSEQIANPGIFDSFPDGALEGQRVRIAFNFVGSDGDEYGMQQTLVDTLQGQTQ